MSGRTDAGDETERTQGRFHPENMGHVFGKLLAISMAVFWLSLVSLVVVLVASSEENPTLTTTNFPVYLAIGSWVGIWASILGYSGWSFWLLRHMEKADDPAAYERRLKRALKSLGMGLFVLVGIPIGILFG
ncbi:hypothetical protein [Natronolimnohabitans innermongolicus]|uniref:Uncharacterized protein n=1 Tax=Natronolimnohabitans innermongolicus JCM 12255 TaxID=1227499 RepID=L9XFV0_9EURY|nr:hypothetical protein [Natronolimnohabitans innermongolicus]ELY60585.1 hypothetical protein C493_03891 [Natronolimnohabitans innermongolicus JCM 12255]